MSTQDRMHNRAREVEIYVQFIPMILATIPIGVGVSEHNIGVPYGPNRLAKPLKKYENPKRFFVNISSGLSTHFLFVKISFLSPQNIAKVIFSSLKLVLYRRKTLPRSFSLR